MRTAKGVGTMVHRSDDLRDWARPVVVFLVAGRDNLAPPRPSAS
ncbi:hypothetical protein ACWDG9_41550 [Streptomyces sp. NPDC001073]